jgi:hypothetical protein
MPHHQPHPSPEQTLRELYAALAFHVPGRGINAGDHRGPAKVLALFARTLELTGGSLQLELQDVAVGREHVLALSRYTASGPSGHLDHRLCHVLRVSDGQVLESWYFTRDQYAVDAFWSQKGAA